jgi:ssDNA-binding Zn-finger/Zn-ribbon topoisomerase 1
MFRYRACSDLGAPTFIVGVCVLNPNKSDATLAKMARTTHTCPVCGHITRHDIPAELRFLACCHAREHEVLA